MSSDFEMPRASNGKRLRRGDSAILSEPPPPLARRSAAELKATILADLPEWWAAARKLIGAERWFRGHAMQDPRSPEIERRAMVLTGVCFRARLSAGNALLAYCAIVSDMEDSPAYWAEREWWAARWRGPDPFDLDPADPVAMWRALFPCPIAMGVVGFQMAGWDRWRDWALGRDPPACRADCDGGDALAFPCLDAGPRVRLTPDA